MINKLLSKHWYKFLFWIFKFSYEISIILGILKFIIPSFSFQENCTNLKVMLLASIKTKMKKLVFGLNEEIFWQNQMANLLEVFVPVPIVILTINQPSLPFSLLLRGEKSSFFQLNICWWLTFYHRKTICWECKIEEKRIKSNISHSGHVNELQAFGIFLGYAQCCTNLNKSKYLRQIKKTTLQLSVLLLFLVWEKNSVHGHLFKCNIVRNSCICK